MQTQNSTTENKSNTNSEEQDSSYVLSKELMIAVVTNLSSLPYSQVAPLLEALLETPSLAEVLEKDAKPNIFVPH